MNRRFLILGLLALATPAAVHLAWQWFSWETLLVAIEPDSGRKAIVRCYCLPAGIDGRYHYYLSFDPPTAFRPVVGDRTLKQSASAVNSDQVVFEWRERHYMGYLQGFDDVEERKPSAIEWDDGHVVVRSQAGVAGVYELRP